MPELIMKLLICSLLRRNNHFLKAIKIKGKVFMVHIEEYGIASEAIEEVKKTLRDSRSVKGS